MHGGAPGRALAGRFMAGAFALRTRRSVRLRIVRGDANRVWRRTRRDRTRTRRKHSAPLAIAFLDFRNATCRSYLPAREADPLRIRLRAPWDLDYYQTVYAKEPGSAEMPSAGRAFTWKLLLDLKRRGIDSAYIVLHTGLSSYMDDELDRAHPASEEEYFVSATTAGKINRTRKSGGRVIAVGTTAVRALESAIDESGRVRAQHGYTRLRIDNKHRLKAVGGLLTCLQLPGGAHAAFLR